MEKEISNISTNLKKNILDEVRAYNEMIHKLIESDILQMDEQQLSNINEKYLAKQNNSSYLKEELKNIGILGNKNIEINENDYKEFMRDFLPNRQEVQNIVNDFVSTQFDEDIKIEINLTEENFINLYKNFMNNTEFDKTMQSKSFAIPDYQFDTLKLLHNPYTCAQIFILNQYLKNKETKLKISYKPEFECSKVDGFKYPIANEKELEKLKSYNEKKLLEEYKHESSNAKVRRKLYKEIGEFTDNKLLLSVNYDTKTKQKFFVIKIKDESRQQYSFGFYPSTMILAHEYTHLLRKIQGISNNKFKIEIEWFDSLYNNMEEYETVRLDFFSENNIAKRHGYNYERISYNNAYIGEKNPEVKEKDFKNNSAIELEEKILRQSINQFAEDDKRLRIFRMRLMLIFIQAYGAQQQPDPNFIPKHEYDNPLPSLSQEFEAILKLQSNEKDFLSEEGFTKDIYEEVKKINPDIFYGVNLDQIRFPVPEIIFKSNNIRLDSGQTESRSESDTSESDHNSNESQTETEETNTESESDSSDSNNYTKEVARSNYHPGFFQRSTSNFQRSISTSQDNSLKTTNNVKSV